MLIRDPKVRCWKVLVNREVRCLKSLEVLGRLLSTSVWWFVHQACLPFSIVACVVVEPPTQVQIGNLNFLLLIEQVHIWSDYYEDIHEEEPLDRIFENVWMRWDSMVRFEIHHQRSNTQLTNSRELFRREWDNLQTLPRSMVVDVAHSRYPLIEPVILSFLNQC